MKLALDVFRVKSRFPDLRMLPRGGFFDVESDSDVEILQILQRNLIFLEKYVKLIGLPGFTPTA